MKRPRLTAGEHEKLARLWRDGEGRALAAQGAAFRLATMPNQRFHKSNIALSGQNAGILRVPSPGPETLEPDPMTGMKRPRLTAGEPDTLAR